MEGFPILYAVFAGSPENELLEEKTSELQAIVDRIPVSTLIYKKQQGHVSIIYTNAYYRSLPFASETQLMMSDIPFPSFLAAIAERMSMMPASLRSSSTTYAEERACRIITWDGVDPTPMRDLSSNQTE